MILNIADITYITSHDDASTPNYSLMRYVEMKEYQF